jgi:hypothetical protein
MGWQSKASESPYQNVSRRKRLAASRQQVSFQLSPAPDKHLSAHPAVQLRRLRQPFRMPPHLALWQPPAARPALACPECLDPFPLGQPFSASLDGRDAVEYDGSAAPARAWGTSPPSLGQEAAAGSGVARTALAPSAGGPLP